MLTLLEAIQKRRSTRSFTPDDVPDEMINQMLEAARLAPSGGNRQPWRFLAVKDKKLKKELCHIGRDQSFIEEAAVVIICFGDLQRYKIKGEQEQSPSAISYEQALIHLKANSYIAIEHLVLMATALGLGTCWVGAYSNNTEVNRLFGLPDNLIGVAGVAVGYPAKDLPAQRPRLSLEEIIVRP
ncbi:nitroreductase family protein [Chloroflexota bacterium]